MRLRQRLEDLCFLHWPVDPATLQPEVPFPLDTHDGRAWLSLVALRIRSGLAVRQLNLRTYVENERVYFLRIDGSSRIATLVSRALFHLPYHFAAVTHVGGSFACRRNDAREIRFRYTPGPEPLARDGLDTWLTERYASVLLHRGRARETVIEHEPWPLRPLAVAIVANTIGPPGPPARAHYVATMDACVRTPA